MKELIFGGARSGKSLLAEQRALASGLHVVYLATAQVPRKRGLAEGRAGLRVSAGGAQPTGAAPRKTCCWLPS